MSTKSLWKSVLLLALGLHTQVYARDAADIIRHIDELWRGDSSVAEMSMSVNTRHYSRTMSMRSWSMGKDHALVVINEPVKDKGIATLKVGENIWNYLPKINRVTKVPASMMSGSWMGSHFTNDDLVRDSSFHADYLTHISFEGERDGRQVVELTSVPKENAAVVWGKVITVVEDGSWIPLLSHYYDEKDNLIRTMRFDQVKQVSERQIPMRMTLQPEDKPGESTSITYHSIAFDVGLDESFFSLQNLQRSR